VLHTELTLLVDATDDLKRYNILSWLVRETFLSRARDFLRLCKRLSQTVEGMFSVQFPVTDKSAG